MRTWGYVACSFCGHTMNPRLASCPTCGSPNYRRPSKSGRARRARFRFDFVIPTPEALALLKEAAGKAGAQHRRWVRPGGLVEQHEFNLDTSAEGWREMFALMARLLCLPGRKVVVPWPMTREGWAEAMRRRGA